MFFFIAGLQTKTVSIENLPQACPNCAHHRLRVKRDDRYLSLFFIPLIRVKQGSPYLICDHCHAYWETPNPDHHHHVTAQSCPNCKRVLENDFSYCPYCGKLIK